MYNNYYGIKFRNPFEWIDGEKDDTSNYYCAEMLINALALYVVSNRPECEHTDEGVYKMLLSHSKREYYDCKYQPLLDVFFEKLEKENPCALELAYYYVFKKFPYKQQLSIIATLRASNFDVRKKMLLNK